MLTEAEAEQQTLSNLHQDWLTPTEQAERRNQELNTEFTRRIARHTHDDKGTNQTPEVFDNDLAIGVVDTSDPESEEGDKDDDRVENFRNNTP